MGHPYWPLFDLRLRTERLELRWPTDEDCVELAALAAKGIHAPDFMPFQMPWTRASSPDLERGAMQFYWSMRANWQPHDWKCILVTRHGGEVIGTQDFQGTRFAIRRVVSSGSWLGRAHQGKGFGKEQRGAMLHLAFDGLGAHRAESGAWEDNGASLGVSRSLGYEENGDELHVVEGVVRRQVRLKISREQWEAHRKYDVEISGLGPCLGLFGLGAESATDQES